MYILYKVLGVHYEYVGMSLVFSRSTKKILGMQRQARRAVFIAAVRLFDTDKKSNKIEPSENFHGVTGMFFLVTYHSIFGIPSLKAKTRLIFHFPKHRFVRKRSLT
jgi:hypothetical protein